MLQVKKTSNTSGSLCEVTKSKLVNWVVCWIAIAPLCVCVFEWCYTCTIFTFDVHKCLPVFLLNITFFIIRPQLGVKGKGWEGRQVFCYLPDKWIVYPASLLKNANKKLNFSGNSFFILKSKAGLLQTFFSHCPLKSFCLFMCSCAAKHVPSSPPFLYLFPAVFQQQSHFFVS